MGPYAPIITTSSRGDYGVIPWYYGSDEVMGNGTPYHHVRGDPHNHHNHGVTCAHNGRSLYAHNSVISGHLGSRDLGYPGCHHLQTPDIMGYGPIMDPFMDPIW